MKRFFRSRRARVFLGGVGGSIFLIVAFFMLAVSPFAYSRLGNATGLFLVRLFEWVNPLLALLAWLSAEVWGSAPPQGLRQLVLSVIAIVLFLAWWWFVARLVDWLVSRGTKVMGDA